MRIKLTSKTAEAEWSVSIMKTASRSLGVPRGLIDTALLDIYTRVENGLTTHTATFDRPLYILSKECLKIFLNVFQQATLVADCRRASMNTKTETRRAIYVS